MRAKLLRLKLNESPESVQEILSKLEALEDEFFQVVFAGDSDR